MSETIHTYYPLHALLKQHVAYYYFLTTDTPDYQIRFHVYPQLQVPVTIHRFAQLEQSGAVAHVHADQNQRHLTLCNGLLKGPLEASISGLQNRVTIVFRPLGINHFIEAPYHTLIGRSIQRFDGWEGPAYTSFLEAFFAAGEHSTRLQLLEAELLRRYRPVSKSDLLYRAVGLLTDFEEQRPVPEVAEACGLTERTLNRLFHTHFSASPVQFRKIARFRRTIELRQSAQKGALTKVAHRSSFFDQSHLIGDYHALTGMQPARFFNAVTRAAGGEVLMRILE